MKQQTKTRGISLNNHLSLTGLSMNQRHSKDYHYLHVPVRNSSHLHLTHSHVHHNLSLLERLRFCFTQIAHSP
jgi:hypothetical protein